jgi:two-component system, sporulation sensor kinase E
MKYSGFIQKVLQKIEKLDRSKIRNIMVELHMEKELYKLVFDSMIEGVIVTNKDRKVILINQAMEHFISVSASRIHFRELEECNFDPEIKGVLEMAIAENQKILDDEVHLHRTDKTYTLSVLPLLSDSETIGHVIIMVDITEKKMREFQLRQAESLAALTTLSAGVAHEIKNPLASIDIHIQLMNREIQKFDQEKVKNMKNLIAIVKEEIDRLNSIVQDFLFAVRPMNMNLSPENINDILQELVDFLKYELEEADIRIVLELDEDLPTVMVDVKYIKQAFINIIKNSIEAIHDSGEIHIKTEEETGGDVVVHIEDTGEGIPESIMGKIFEPYFTTRKSGTGLGLVIVYKIIKELGGDIKINSREGEGTSFSVKLPVHEKKKRLLTYEESDESQVINSR